LDEQLETTRELESQEEKRNKSDFALWKHAAPEHIMRWKSPWGEGFPGWHIECSAMSTKYLGERFDIHGGGMDLQFPHHECEIAQSVVCNHEVPARYWLHNNMITINGKKMGKSYNNVIKLSELFSGEHPILQQAYSPMTVRFFILQTHYRSTLDFSNEALQGAEKGMKRLWEAYTLLMQMQHDGSKTVNTEVEAQLLALAHEFNELMDDDFNTAKVLANMFTMVNHINSFKSGAYEKQTLSAAALEELKKQFTVFLVDIFGMKMESAGNDDKLDGVLKLIIDIRRDARSKKDFVTSDKIRNALQEVGIALKDEKDGSVSWTVA
jgi:cysteinyl-tRNA synthetase